MGLIISFILLTVGSFIIGALSDKWDWFFEGPMYGLAGFLVWLVLLLFPCLISWGDTPSSSGRWVRQEVTYSSTTEIESTGQHIAGIKIIEGSRNKVTQYQKQRFHSHLENFMSGDGYGWRNLNVGDLDSNKSVYRYVVEVKK